MRRHLLGNYIFRSISLLLLITLVIQPLFVSAETDLEKKERELREQLEQIEKEQSIVESTLNVQRAQSASIQRDINVLSSQIKQAQLDIQKRNLIIGELGEDIELKDQTVKQLNEKMERSKNALADLLRQTKELDNTSVLEVVLNEENLSEFFVELDNYSRVKDSLEGLFDEIRELRGLTESEKLALKAKQDKERDVREEISNTKRTIELKEDEKEGLLSVSKQSEQSYEAILKAKQQQAANIRAALFQLRDTKGISFGDALDYAKTASSRTGVRPAFILAILKQETDLGKNVGTCNRAGDPPEKKWNVIMPGPNDGNRSYRDDQTIFLRITKNLGLDPDNTPLSCPWGTGWGGAMGPSQFIPTTWQAYESRIAAALGITTPNPWNPEHAFTATSIYLADLGAGAGGYTAERTAALKYYAGSNWSLPANAFYGNSVMQHATVFQEQIDFLKEVDE